MRDKILIDAINRLLPLARDGRRLHVSNGVHQEFLKEDDEDISFATEALSQYRQSPPDKSDWRDVLRKMTDDNFFDDKFNPKTLEFNYAFQMGFKAGAWQYRKAMVDAETFKDAH